MYVYIYIIKNLSSFMANLGYPGGLFQSTVYEAPPFMAKKYPMNKCKKPKLDQV
jgi:hypothetical protein